MHGPAAEHVQMQMLDRLAAVRTRIHHNPKSIGEILFRRQRGCDGQQVAEQRLVLSVELGKRADMLARNDQQMRRGLGMKVGEGDRGFVLIHLLRRNLALHDFAE